MEGEHVTHFRVVVSEGSVERMGCPVSHGDKMHVDSCRGCSITADVIFAVDMGEMTIRQTDRPDDRILDGTTSGPFGRRTLSRVVAFAYEHPDPVFIKGWFDDLLPA
jgi:hypothetical protein